jgi:hypothetical protein
MRSRIASQSSVTSGAELWNERILISHAIRIHDLLLISTYAELCPLQEVSLLEFF